MQDFLNQVLQNFKEFYSSLDKRRRASLLVIAGGIVIGLIMLTSWITKTQYKLLYSELSNEDSAKIQQILNNAKVDYQPKNGGKEIYVSEDQVDNMRLEIAKMGVNFNSTVGYEIFDKQAFGTTSFVQKINKQMLKIMKIK